MTDTIVLENEVVTLSFLQKDTTHRSIQNILAAFYQKYASNMVHFQFCVTVSNSKLYFAFLTRSKIYRCDSGLTSMVAMDSKNSEKDINDL